MKDFRARELQTTSTAKLGMGGLATGGGGGGSGVRHCFKSQVLSCTVPCLYRRSFNPLMGQQRLTYPGDIIFHVFLCKQDVRLSF